MAATGEKILTAADIRAEMARRNVGRGQLAEALNRKRGGKSGSVYGWGVVVNYVLGDKLELAQEEYRMWAALVGEVAAGAGGGE